MNKNLIIMMLKEPKEGFVKTRLAKSLGEEKTLNLYKCFVKDLIKTLNSCPYDFILCTYGEEKLIQENFGLYNSFKQTKGDLGCKMHTAFEKMFLKNYENIVLIGSDTPHLRKESFSKTFEALEEKKLVLGPSEDGGYYLIAFNKTNYKKELFENISWSTDAVLEQTLQKVNKKDVCFLEVLNDIDIQEDLNAFYKLYKNSFFKNSATISYIKENNLCKTTM